jgi:hypothetical protein
VLIAELGSWENLVTRSHYYLLLMYEAMQCAICCGAGGRPVRGDQRYAYRLASAIQYI